MLLPTHRQSENALPVITVYFWIWGGTCKGGFDLSSCQPNCKSLITLLRGIVFYIWGSKCIVLKHCTDCCCTTIPLHPPCTELFLSGDEMHSPLSRTLLPSQQVNVVPGGFVLNAEVEAGYFQVMYWWVYQAKMCFSLWGILWFQRRIICFNYG